MNTNDVIKFFLESKRICEKNKKHCSSCPLFLTEKYCCFLKDSENFLEEDIYNTIKKVELWILSNPKKTRQTEFLKLLKDYPKNFIEVSEEEVLEICPQDIISSYPCNNSNCRICMKNFWYEEIE